MDPQAENLTRISLTQGKLAIVDPEKLCVLSRFHWRAVQAHYGWYAKADVGDGVHKTSISMHRFIARTPFGQVCHHKNGNTLDNRFENLENMDKLSHTIYHQNNSISRKFEVKSQRHPL